MPSLQRGRGCRAVGAARLALPPIHGGGGLFLCAWLAALMAPASVAWAHQPVSVEVAAASRRIADDPEDPTHYLVRAELYRLEHRWDRASADLERAAALAPATPGIALCRAALLFDQGLTGRALAALDTPTSSSTTDPRRYDLRSRIHEALGQAQAAIADLDTAIAAATRPHPDRYLRRCSLQERLGEGGLEAALSGLDQGIQEIGPVPGLLDRTLEIECRLARFDRALARLEKVGESYLPLESRMIRSAQILERAGRPTEALAVWSEALDHAEAQPRERRSSPLFHELRTRARAALASPAARDSAP